MTDPDDEQGPPAATPGACLRCRTTMDVVGVEELRVGGSTGAAKFFLGEWGEIGEGKLALEMSVCPACRYVEFRAPG